MNFKFYINYINFYCHTQIVSQIVSIFQSRTKENTGADHEE